MQAGGHRFDPGWLHGTKRLLIARFLAVAFALDWDRWTLDLLAGAIILTPTSARSWSLDLSSRLIPCR